MTKLILLILIFANTVYVTGASADETIYPLVTYKCNPEADIITMTSSLLKGAEGATYNYSDENGIYSPWNLVEIDRRAAHTRIVRTKKSPKPAPSAPVNIPLHSNHRFSVKI